MCVKAKATVAVCPSTEDWASERFDIFVLRLDNDSASVFTASPYSSSAEILLSLEITAASYLSCATPISETNSALSLRSETFSLRASILWAPTVIGSSEWASVGAIRSHPKANSVAVAMRNNCFICLPPRRLDV